MGAPQLPWLLALGLLLLSASAQDQPETTVSVSAESMAYAACSFDDAVITGVVNPIFGVPGSCNASDSYRWAMPNGQTDTGECNQMKELTPAGEHACRDNRTIKPLC